MINKIRMYLTQLLCPHCAENEGVVEEINSRLSPEKRIRNVNVTWDFNYNFNLNPISKVLDADSTPSTYLSGRLMEGTGGREYFKSFLKSYLERKGDIKKTYFDEYFDL